VIRPTQGPLDITQHSQDTDIYATDGIRTRKHSKRAAADPCLRPRGHRDWQLNAIQIYEVGCVWNVMAHAQKPDFVFRRNGRVHLNLLGRQFSRLLAAEVCASAVVMLDTPCCEVVRRVLTTHSIRQFPLHFPSRTSPCAITFQLDSTHNTVLDVHQYTGPYSTLKICQDFFRWFITVVFRIRVIWVTNKFK